MPFFVEIYRSNLLVMLLMGSLVRCAIFDNLIMVSSITPHAWFKKFSATLLEFGFVRCISVYCVFVKKTARGCAISLVYVNDMVISDSDEDGIQKTKDWLKSRLHIKDQGQLQYFLGIEDLRNRQGIYPSRKKCD